mmetsp:Transcript_33579/g.132486  ORF Transcript_33579/g.132486 Transcript_33579/m.132486 type:complete len:214 (-) Transcript_33579:238-879(-)
MALLLYRVPRGESRMDLLALLQRLSAATGSGQGGLLLSTCKLWNVASRLCSLSSKAFPEPEAARDSAPRHNCQTPDSHEQFGGFLNNTVPLLSKIQLLFLKREISSPRERGVSSSFPKPGVSVSHFLSAAPAAELVQYCCPERFRSSSSDLRHRWTFTATTSSQDPLDSDLHFHEHKLRRRVHLGHLPAACSYGPEIGQPRFLVRLLAENMIE